jgi:ADP-heptose:LPS heptosyltransferase
MANNRNTGSWKRFLFALLGRSNGRRILTGIVRRKTAHLPPLSFPIDAAAVKRLLLILPTGPLAVLHQLKNIASLKAFFKNAETTLLTEASCTEIAGMIEDVTIVEYRLEEKRLFSASFGVFNRSLKDAADVCCLLTDGEDLPLLYCCGRTAAQVRVGYAGAGTYPFINLHVSPSQERRYLTDRNLVMAETLGAPPAPADSWAVAGRTLAEVGHFFREHRIGAATRPVGVDAFYFYRAFGARQAEEVVRTIVPVVHNNLYLYADETPDAQEMEWLSRFKLPIMHHLSITQLGTLLGCSGPMVTGNTVLFGLAALLGTKAAGVFTKDEIEFFCPKTPVVRGIVRRKTIDADVVKRIVEAVVELAGT